MCIEAYSFKHGGLRRVRKFGEYKTPTGLSGEICRAGDVQATSSVQHTWNGIVLSGQHPFVRLSE